MARRPRRLVLVVPLPSDNLVRCRPPDFTVIRDIVRFRRNSLPAACHVASFEIIVIH